MLLHCSYIAFRVKCAENLCSLYTSLHGVPQCPVCSPLLFIIYTITLSHLISFLGLNHHFYIHDTFNFLPNFDSRIIHLRECSTTQLFLDDYKSLNSSTTKFLLIRLKHNLLKLVPCRTDGRSRLSGFQAVVTLTLYPVIRHIFLLFLLLPILSSRRLDVYHTSTHDVALV